jgi:predicted DNA-binding protein with PD1-like motif
MNHKIMRQLTFRLLPGQDLKQEIEKHVQEHKVTAGCLGSIVGGLEVAVLRMAGSTPDNQTVKTFSGPFEIVAGTGTLSLDKCHIHLSLSDREGRVIGGHLKQGCIIAFTAEITLLIFDDVVFRRKPDSVTGFDELMIS